MAKTSVDTSALATKKVAKKERLRQAKREAKLMLRLEQARTKVQKAEKKVAKNQSKLETTKNNVSTLEEQLAQMKLSSDQSTFRETTFSELESTEKPKPNGTMVRGLVSEERG